MALETICGVNKKSYMKRFDELSSEMAKREFHLSRCNFKDPLTLLAPPFENPAAELNKLVKKYKVDLESCHGTTTLGFIYQGGTILATDSRSTVGDKISDRNMDKIVEISDHILGTIAGGAADCLYWDRALTRECRLHELRYHCPLPVKSAARYLCNIADFYRGCGLAMGMLLAGWDQDSPVLSYVDSEGVRNSGDLFAVGSGSAIAYDILDTAYKPDMTNEEAYELAQRAIYYAVSIDRFTGGSVSLYHVTKEGWKNVSNTDATELFERYRKEKPHVSAGMEMERGEGEEVLFMSFSQMQ